MSGERRWLRLPRVGRADVRAEVLAEVHAHLEMQVAELVNEGWAEEDARAEALRRFGEREGIEREMVEISTLRERESRRAQWWDAVGQDVQYAVRLLRRSPAFAAVVVLTLALGIGANTAVFSAVDAALLRPLPLGAPDRLVSVWSRYVPESGSDYEWMTLSAPEVRDYREATRAMSGVAAYTTGQVNLASEGSPPDRVAIAEGGANLFDVLQVRAAFGRTFEAAEDAAGASCVVVASHGLAVERFGAAPAAVGEVLRVDGNACAVVGVMAPEFVFPNDAIRLWRAFSPDMHPLLAHERDSHWLRAIARLAPGATLESAQAELMPMMSAWRAADEHHLGHFIVLNPFRNDVVGEQRATLILLLGAVGLVLLIICANLANLLLTRAEGRRREMAVRVALGAGQGRLVRQLLTESLLLTLLGGALAIGVAQLLIHLLPGLGGEGAGATGLELDTRVLAFTAFVSVLTGIIFGLIPALQAPALRVQETLRTEGRGATAHGRSARVRRALVVVEIALSLAVVSAAALLMRSYERLRRVDVGMTRDEALVLDVTLPASDYAGTARIAAFHGALRDAVSALPGVRSAGLVSNLPLRSQPGMDGFRIEGRPEPQPGEPSYSGGYVMSTPGYFEAVGMRVLRGRGIQARDVLGAPLVAVIDELAAQRYWPDQDPIGQRIRYYGADSAWITIVGIVSTVHYQSPRLNPRPAVYTAHAQAPRAGFYTGRSMTLAVDADNAASLLPAIRDIVQRLDPQVPITNVARLEDVIADTTGRPRVATNLMGLFALASLLIGALGVYGVLSYLVRARTQEIGIRMALGATAASVQRMVLRQGMTLALVGIGVGTVAALASARLLEGMLFGVSATDPFMLALVALVLGGVCLLASYLPARRATRVDPAAAVRNG